MYKLLTNQDPPSVSNLSEDETEDKHLALPMPNVSEEMKKLVVWMMQVNRLKRPKIVDEILQKLSTETNNNEETKTYSSNQPHTNHASGNEETVWADNVEQCKEVDKHEKNDVREQANTESSNSLFGIIFWMVIAFLVILAILISPPV